MAFRSVGDASDADVERMQRRRLGSGSHRMNQRELLVDCLGRLNRTGVSYYVTGSMASNYWGVPRRRMTSTLW